MPYTAQAKAASGNITQDANLGIALANKALKYSGVKAKFALAGIPFAEYASETSDFAATLEDLQQGNGDFARIHTERNARKADLVALLRGDGDYCGLGYLLENTTAADAPWAFSASAVSCIAYNVVGHEIGHNSGLRHDRFVEPSAPTSEYNFGYVNEGAQIRSVMSYANACTSCSSVPMYSSAKRKYKGDRMGIKKGRKGAADAARALTENKKALSKFR